MGKLNFLMIPKWILLSFQYIRTEKKEFLNLVTVLGKPQPKRCHFYLGIAQIAIVPPPALNRALWGTFFGQYVYTIMKGFHPFSQEKKEWNLTPKFMKNLTIWGGWRTQNKSRQESKSILLEFSRNFTSRREVLGLLISLGTSREKWNIYFSSLFTSQLSETHSCRTLTTYNVKTCQKFNEIAQMIKSWKFAGLLHCAARTPGPTSHRNPPHRLAN